MRPCRETGLSAPLPFAAFIRPLQLHARFELFKRAGEIVRPHGTTALRMSDNRRLKKAFLRVGEGLAQALRFDGSTLELIS